MTASVSIHVRCRMSRGRHREGAVDITEVRITLRNEEKLKAFANVTFERSFVVRGLKVISRPEGYFVSMPSRRRSDGTYQDICHPIHAEARRELENAVLEAYEKALSETVDKEDVKPADSGT
jgi:stage V sporulation protein G